MAHSGGSCFLIQQIVNPIKTTIQVIDRMNDGQWPQVSMTRTLITFVLLRMTPDWIITNRKLNLYPSNIWLYNFPIYDSNFVETKKKRFFCRQLLSWFLQQLFVFEQHVLRLAPLIFKLAFRLGVCQQNNPQ